MRICSLLPGITDTLVALGAAEQIVGVTHECDVPPAHGPAVVTSSRMEIGETSAEIDRQVRRDGRGLFCLDRERLRCLSPDLILTQALCDVCAVDEGLVRDVARDMPGSVHVESFQPTTVAEVLAMFDRIGRLTGRQTDARQLIGRFQRRIAELTARTLPGRRPRVLCLEWLDPPFACGHWTPELVAVAGGSECLGRAGEASFRTTWELIARSEPEIVVVAPCGFTVERTLSELPVLSSDPAWQALPAVTAGRAYVADGAVYFNRPGPGLFGTLNVLATAIGSADGARINVDGLVCL